MEDLIDVPNPPTQLKMNIDLPPEKFIDLRLSLNGNQIYYTMRKECLKFANGLLLCAVIFAISSYVGIMFGGEGIWKCFLPSFTALAGIIYGINLIKYVKEINSIRPIAMLHNNQFELISSRLKTMMIQNPCIIGTIKRSNIQIVRIIGATTRYDGIYISYITTSATRYSQLFDWDDILTGIETYNRDSKGEKARLELIDTLNKKTEENNANR